MADFRLSGVTVEIPENPQGRENLKNNLQSSMVIIGGLYNLFDKQFDRISKKQMVNFLGGTLVELNKTVQEIEKLQKDEK